ncbi:FAD-binding protein [Sphingomonas sp. MMS24-JH45]
MKRWNCTLCPREGGDPDWAPAVAGAHSCPRPPHRVRPARPARLVQVGLRAISAVRAQGRRRPRRLPARPRPGGAGHGAGLGSNLLVRDGGVPGVVVRLGKPFATVTAAGDTLTCGGGASGILVSSTARDAGIAGVEFLRSIPGTVGGFVRMNGGAYGRETGNAPVSADVVLRSGERRTLPAADLGYTYRHSALPDGAVVVAATFRGIPGEPAAIQAEMDRHRRRARGVAAAAFEEGPAAPPSRTRRAQGLAIGGHRRLPRPPPR